MKRKMRKLKRIYYTHNKVRKLTDILKLKYVVKAIENGDLLHTYFNEIDKEELEKCFLKTYGDNVYDPTVLDENYVMEKLCDFPEKELFYSKCLVSTDNNEKC